LPMKSDWHDGNPLRTACRRAQQHYYGIVLNCDGSALRKREKAAPKGDLDSTFQTSLNK
jgi:hypothetical protein